MESMVLTSMHTKYMFINKYIQLMIVKQKGALHGL